MERQLSDAEVTAIGYALLMATGNEAIIANIRDVAAKYFLAKHEQIRSLAEWWVKLKLS